MHVRSSTLFVVVLLWFAGLGAAAQFAKIAVPFGLVRQAYPHIGSEIGWLLSLISLVGALLGIVAGDLIGRVGAKRVLLWGLMLGAAMSFWQTAQLLFVTMLLSRLLEGASHLAIVVAAPTLIAQVSSRRYVGAAMALWSTFFGVSFAITAWVVMPLIGAGGLAVLFGGHGVFMAAVAAIVALTIPGSDRDPQSPSLRIVEAHLNAYSSPRVAAPGAGWLLYTLTFVSLLALLPEQLSPDGAAWAAGLMPLVSIAVSLTVVPLLLRWLSSISVVVIGFSLASLVTATSLVLELELAFAVSLFAVLGLVQGASFSAVPELNSGGRDQALAYGVMAQAGNVGNLLGTPVLIALAAAGGEGVMYLSIVAMYAVGVCVHLLLARRRLIEGA